MNASDAVRDLAREQARRLGPLTDEACARIAALLGMVPSPAGARPGTGPIRPRTAESRPKVLPCPPGTPAGPGPDQGRGRAEGLAPSVIHTDRPQLIKESQREIAAATGVNQATVSRSTSDADASEDDLDEPADEPVEKPPRARHLIEAAAIAEQMVPIGTNLPANEGQARELTGLDEIGGPAR